MSHATTEFLELAPSLGAALAVGLMVGLERGWAERDTPEGGRVAGLRTFALIGLLGGVLQFAPSAGTALAVGLAAIALLFAVAYARVSEAAGTLSITTAVAALVTFGLGALAAHGQPLLAVSAAVVTALLLGLKPVLHGGLRELQAAELNAVLQLGVLSAVILPLLPDTAMGPYGAINPFRLWVAVVLIAGLSLAGHFATRLLGGHTGLLWVGLLGGLTSSTAATLALSRTARDTPALAQAAAAAVLAAWGVMFARMAVVILALQPAAGLSLSAFLGLLALATFASSAWHWRHARTSEPVQIPPGDRVFDLPTAVGFGLALGVIAVVARAAMDQFGSAGLYAVAFLSGLADVDAIVISTTQLLGQGQVTLDAASAATLLAVLANTLVKAGMARVIGGPAVGRPVILSTLAVTAVGLVALVAARQL